ncbi:hypothetical protein [Legionella drancourtii]|uniref:Uncharacterized protein n=1 Tax=Legionella drancourtii LLAP12 TaxID=658187 RepID=G9EPW1_9GAMM|nr:hypothetical protein [Legionella drancourtii]EHL30663.1 hypothetical protein LDG_7302 [Legionella drancourtii LLAP12]
MGKTVFEVLDLDITNDFIQLKQAYIRKLRELSAAVQRAEGAEEETAALKELLQTYRQVNTEVKFQDYYEVFCTGDAVAISLDLSNDDVEKSDELNLIDIFIPIFVLHKKNSQGSTIFYPPVLEDNDAIKFRNNFDFAHLAEFLTSLSKKSSFQVGLTRQEAEDIANQHSHHRYQAIVHVTIPLSGLSTSRKTESQTWGPGLLSAKSDSNYFWLHKNKSFLCGDIITIGIMELDQYHNTPRFLSSGYGFIPLQSVWPSECTVVNHRHPLVIDYQTINQSASDDDFLAATYLAEALKRKEQQRALESDGPEFFDDVNTFNYWLSPLSAVFFLAATVSRFTSQSATIALAVVGALFDDPSLLDSDTSDEADYEEERSYFLGTFRS